MSTVQQGFLNYKPFDGEHRMISIKKLAGYVLVGAGLLWGTFEVFAQESAAKLTCDKPVFDFGQQDNSESIEHDFVIRNDGNETLEIIKAKPSCGCTVANISNKTVEPGATSIITAKLSLAGRTGKQHKTITVTSNDPQSPRSILTLKGEATTLVDVQPKSFHASNLTPGQIATNKIHVTSREDEPLEIISVETGTPLITAEIVEIEPGKKFEIIVLNAETLPKGPTFGRVVIKTSSKRRPIVNVAYRLVVVGEISVYPQEIAMVQQDTPLKKTLVVSPGTVTDFEVTDVEVPNEDIKVDIRNLSGGRYRVLLSNILPSIELNGKEIHVLTTATNMEDVTIPLKVIKTR